MEPKIRDEPRRLSVYEILTNKKLTWIASEDNGAVEMQFKNRTESSPVFKPRELTLFIVKMRADRQKRGYCFATSKGEVRVYDTLAEAQGALMLHRPD